LDAFITEKNAEKVISELEKSPINDKSTLIETFEEHLNSQSKMNEQNESSAEDMEDYEDANDDNDEKDLDNQPEESSAFIYEDYVKEHEKINIKVDITKEQFDEMDENVKKFLIENVKLKCK
jgi:hypothetical protein